MNIRGLFVIFLIFIYLLVVIFLVWWIAFEFDKSPEALMAGALFILAPVGALLFEPVRNYTNSWTINSFVNPSIYRIVIYGRPGTGKSTFIKNVFTVCEDTENQSTLNFDYYKFKINFSLNKEDYVDVAIADYRGQVPGQIILPKGKTDFFGDENNRLINAIIFIVDMVPRKNDEHGKLLNSDALMKWIGNGDGISKIDSRCNENYEYINEASLGLIFQSLYSKNLQKVVFLINKIDLIEMVIENGHITLPNFANGKQYAKYKFERMISNIQTACSDNRIDFLPNESVFCIQAKNKNDVASVISHLLKK